MIMVVKAGAIGLLLRDPSGGPWQSWSWAVSRPACAASPKVSSRYCALAMYTHTYTMWQQCIETIIELCIESRGA